MAGKRKRRVPQCARCRCHNIFASVRGHKRQCQWKDCTCSKCLMVTEKRRVTAVRVAVLRRERKRRMSYTMGINAYHVGLPGSWGIMGRMPTACTDQPLSGKRRRSLASLVDWIACLISHISQLFRKSNGEFCR